MMALELWAEEHLGLIVLFGFIAQALVPVVVALLGRRRPPVPPAATIGEPTAPNTELGKATVPELVSVARYAGHPEFLVLRDTAMRWGWQPHDAERLAAEACSRGGTEAELKRICDARARR
jgi:hypothetical protein